MNNTDDIIRKKLNELFGSDRVIYKGKNSICSTCKNFNGKLCSKGRSFGGFATKLSDCGEWEVCGG